MKTSMYKPAAAPAPAPAVSDVDIASVRLLDLDLIPDQWHRMSIADKAAAAAAKLGIGPQEQILLVSRLDQLHPPPKVMQYRERSLAVPMRSVVYHPAGQAEPQATTGSMVGWALMFLIAAGFVYATVNIEPKR